MIREHFFDSRAELLSALEGAINAELDRALAGGARASLLLSGGSTPGPVYEQLGQSLSDRVAIALVDERWVDLAHEGSNEALLARCFPRHAITGMKTADVKPQDALAEVNARYARLPQPFALTLLGMGPDGHTASLFPHADGLGAALASDAPLCAAITATQSEVTGPLVARMTLSLPAILASRKIILLITGQDKLAVYRAAKTTQSVLDAPVAAVLQQDKVDVDVYWAA